MNPQIRRLLTRLAGGEPVAVPAGYDLGQTVGWDEPAPDLTGLPVRRTGTVWSYGPRDASMWVLPDDGGSPVVVDVKRCRTGRVLVRGGDRA